MVFSLFSLLWNIFELDMTTKSEQFLYRHTTRCLVNIPLYIVDQISYQESFYRG
uniref:Uncharacterized protein n=1 Tax=Anguilla anguilla TaxID=7936 RepID=A0A0E9VWH4_ANGAN